MSLRTCSLGLALCLLALTGSPAARAQLIEGTDYRKLDSPVPTENPGKIEVVEFFSYGCPHCSEFYAPLSAWAAKLPADVVLRRVPVGFNRDAWINLARAFYALEASGDLKKLDGPLFHAIHEEHLKLFDEPSLAEWVGQHGGNADAFAKAYTDFGVNTRTVQGDKLAADYRVEGIPAIAVAGQYVMLADANQTPAKYYTDLLQHTELMIAQLRAQAPAKPPAKPKGK
jgi:protein dithiol oxidoreductase (disulfide-forming)